MGFLGFIVKHLRSAAIRWKLNSNRLRSAHFGCAIPQHLLPWRPMHFTSVCAMQSSEISLCYKVLGKQTMKASGFLNFSFAHSASCFHFFFFFLVLRGRSVQRGSDTHCCSQRGDSQVTCGFCCGKKTRKCSAKTTENKWVDFLRNFLFITEW